MDGLAWRDVVLYILLPLVLGAYGYSWMGFHSVWAGIEKLRDSVISDLRAMRDNEIHHLEMRIERLERRP